MNFDFLNVPKSFLTSIYKKLEEKAAKANMTVKEFLSKPGNRDHISLVVYDIFPLPIKLSLRYEKFKGFFDQNYEKFVVKMLDIKMSAGEQKINTIAAPSNDVVTPKKTVKSKVSATKADKSNVKSKSKVNAEVLKDSNQNLGKKKSIPVIMPSKKNGVRVV